MAVTKKRKTKKVKLTKYELELLQYPPTPETWVCPTHKKDDGSNFTVINNGKNKTCWLCNKEKPSRPKKLWKDYQLVCSKLGIEEGTPWKVVQKILNPPREES